MATATGPVPPRSVARRIRASGIEAGAWLVARLPEGATVRTAEAVGELWYRMAPARAAQARLNLGRVCGWLVESGMASERVGRAAADPAELERLVRRAFRHSARYYLEVSRTPVMSGEYIRRHLVIETPELIDEAFKQPPVIFVGLHFGAIELPAVYLVDRSQRPAVAPMETVDDPDLQAWFMRTRGAIGLRIVGLREARRELLAALRRGESVGLVGDRDLTGGGIEIEFFGAPAPLPAGPGLLVMEANVPAYLMSVRRTGIGRYRGRLDRLPMPSEGSRRERLMAYLNAEARVFERAIALAPEQWWAIFFPIWPDLVPPAAPGRGTGGSAP